MLYLVNSEMRILQNGAKKLYIGRKIREIREQHRATQSGFAERLEFQRVISIENNWAACLGGGPAGTGRKLSIDIGAISWGTTIVCYLRFPEALADPVSTITSRTCRIRSLLRKMRRAGPCADRLPPVSIAATVNSLQV